MKGPSSTFQFLLLGIALTLLTGCDNQKAGLEPDSTRTDGGTPAAAPSVSPADTASGRIAPLDPAIGRLTVTAAGVVSGNWTFDDVNGSIEETARGGAAISTLQLEAHQEPPGVHMRLRLSRTDDQLSPGRYSIGDSRHALDAAFEYQGRYFRSVGGANGSVELTKLTEDRAAGTFEVTLEDLTPQKGQERVSGSFDMIVQK